MNSQPFSETGQSIRLQTYKPSGCGFKSRCIQLENELQEL